MRADAPVMPPETLPRSSEVGEIDTRAPFQSVRDAVSLFRQVSFSKQQQQQQQQRLSSSTSSQVPYHSLFSVSFSHSHCALF